LETMVVYKTSYLKNLRTNKFNRYSNWYLTGIYLYLILRNAQH
jgi:hypothetical protein